MRKGRGYGRRFDAVSDALILHVHVAAATGRGQYERKKENQKKNSYGIKRSSRKYSFRRRSHTAAVALQIPNDISPWYLWEHLRYLLYIRRIRGPRVASAIGIARCRGSEEEVADCQSGESGEKE